MMLAVTDVVWNAVIAGVVTLVLARMAHLAAGKAEQVRLELARVTRATTEKLDGIATVGKKTHTLVNSNMSIQLKISMVALRRLADITKHPDDVAAASFADKNYREHESNQAIVDQDEAKRPAPSNT
jgi:hypothetical protein